MNNTIDYAMVKHLVLKDWYLQRWYLLAYLLVGILALGVVSIANEFWFAVGSIGLVAVLVWLGTHLAMSTVIVERKEQTLAFVMSLPISVKEYTLAKILANLLIFGLAWVLLLVFSYVLIGYSEKLPDGLIPYTTIMLGNILVSTCLVLGVTLVSESYEWMVAASIFGMLAFQVALYPISNWPAIENNIRKNQVIWNQEAIALIVLDLVIVVLILAITFYFQFRKKDFI
jgi:ABC-2 type transport system permease protein